MIDAGFTKPYRAADGGQPVYIRVRLCNSRMMIVSVDIPEVY